MNGAKEKSIWESYVDVFKKACYRQDYDCAQIILDNAFIDAEERLELDNRILWCVYSLAACYLSNGCNKKATKLYEKLIAIKEKIFGRNHPTFSDSLERLALLQAKANEHKKRRKLGSLGKIFSFGF